MTDLTKALMYESFSNYSDGHRLENVPNFDACLRGKVDTVEGTKAVHTSIEKGDQGWGRWGYENAMPNLKKGDEIWYRAMFFFPSDFDFSTDHGSLKTFRFGRRTISGRDNRGCIDLQIKTNRYWRVGVEYDWKEYDQQGNYWVEFDKGRVELGKWQMFEVYVGFDDKPASQGGIGRIRMWLDGALIGDISDRPTISVGSDDELYRFLMFTYWNGNAPKSQGMWLDHITAYVEGAGYTQKQYLSKDEDGHPYIGTALEGSIPNPPIDSKYTWTGAPTPPPAVVGIPYHYGFGHLIQGPRPILCSMAVGALQEGLVLDSVQEAIVGTPTQVGEHHGLQIAVEE